MSHMYIYIHLQAQIIQCCFTLIHLRGPINKNLVCPCLQGWVTTALKAKLSEIESLMHLSVSCPREMGAYTCCIHAVCVWIWHRQWYKNRNTFAIENLEEDQRIATFPHLPFSTFSVHLFENHCQNGPVDTRELIWAHHSVMCAAEPSCFHPLCIAYFYLTQAQLYPLRSTAQTVAKRRPKKPLEVTKSNF